MFERISLFLVSFLFCSLCKGQDASGAFPFGEAVADPIAQSGLTVELKQFAEMPATSDAAPRARINAMTALRDGSGRLFVNDLRGKLYEVSSGEPKLYMDYAALVPDLHHKTGLGSGLGSVAFHPNFNSNGKFYTTHVEVTDPPRDSGQSRGFGRGWSAGVVSEWTTSDPEADHFEGKRRELLRVALPTDVHGMQEISFNPNTKLGEADYGMLYVCLGEGGSMQTGRLGELRNLRSPLGCILRIDPAGTGSLIGDYGIPSDNPWANHEDPKVLGEIWCMGIRNPHRMTWDAGGSGRMLFSDIGEMRVEEINIGEPGRDYGWPIREGVYRFDSATRHLVYDLSEVERNSEPDLTYPVAQYDHTEGYAISGGGVYRGKNIPALYGKYIFGDIVSGRLFYVEESQLRFGSFAPVSEFNISIGGELMSLARLIGGGRVDLRLGWDAGGELYVFEKGLGIVYKAVGAKRENEGQSTELKDLDRQLIHHAVKVDPDHAIVALGKNPEIDDMEDGDLNLLPLEGRKGTWDRTSLASQLIQVIELEDAPGNGSHALKLSSDLSGRDSPKVILQLVGKSDAGIRLHYDGTAYDGLQFWVKGSQRARMTFKINTPYTIPVSEGGLCDGDSYECGNDFECRVNVEENWALIRLPFTQFLQSGLPNDGPLDPATLKTIGFTMKSIPGLSIFLDDISFYKDE
ncbi:MAG: glucose/arabinose dehydrogenase [Candidatus Pelagisphaera sp.]|jgi:glucose/arabinose dehydrogenase